ncbi:hypothetical protein FJTKL_03101 [Diaporthe vaccinii]|uniref:Trichodiene oxygenase n=1 Tax=Diaporthe vaccinii TaxID=105482 RepID=A0ABR4DX90_9PEZI
MYRLSPLHPLHKFPGTRLAAASYLYEVWFDSIKGGQYTFEIKRLHDIYGKSTRNSTSPIIRINPGELHCNDPDSSDEVYAPSNRKRDKPPLYGSHLTGANQVSGFATTDHDLHRIRREPLRKKFSVVQLSKLEAEVHALAQHLGDKILASSAVFDVQDAMSCLTSDVASLQVFGEPFGFVEQQQGFQPNLKRASYAVFTTYFVFRWIQPLKWLFGYGGNWLACFMPEEVAQFQHLNDVESPRKFQQAKPSTRREKTAERITGEYVAILLAGTETTSWALTVLTFYLLTDKGVLKKLTTELKSAVDSPSQLPRWSTLEQLPYLNAVVHEGLRLSYGVTQRLPRVPTQEDLLYLGSWAPAKSNAAAPTRISYMIPRWYAASMSNGMMHHNESVFPESHRFLPERWLHQDGSRSKSLDRYLMSFNRGSRICLGMHLAYCETYLALSVLVLRVFPHLQSYETTVDNVRPASDAFIPFPKKGSKGVRAVMKE